MGTVFAVASCGGPLIPFRGGRIDTTVPGPATVPEPHQDLESHIASFKRQGFNKSEMIALVACGHALGGVQQVDFPTIVNNADEFASFDTTLDKFDNAVYVAVNMFCYALLTLPFLSVTEYLAGTTTNPLITITNVTTRSDLRIFSSDGNATMQRAFNATCGRLFERMINTVPKNVKLTAPVEPFENKVKGFAYYTNNGSYALDVSLRVNPTIKHSLHKLKSEIIQRLTPNPQRTVTLFWKERQETGSPCANIGCFANSTTTRTFSSSFFGKLKGVPIQTHYIFNARIPLKNSVSNFWFLVDEHDGSAPTMVDNQGSGFPVTQDTVLYDPVRTNIVSTGGFNSSYALVVAVRNNSIGSSSPSISVESYQTRTPDFIPLIETVELQPDATNPPADGYVFFTGNVSTSASAIHINAVVGGKTFKLYRGADDL
ncbi:hypothetical protein H0H87_001080 [Tephrocybe sp. NHM501043]|nr:hypothetical protein H0H87_001080 [Tephrocybe sp. NHM501043]